MSLIRSSASNGGPRWAWASMTGPFCRRGLMAAAPPCCRWLARRGQSLRLAADRGSLLLDRPERQPGRELLLHQQEKRDHRQRDQARASEQHPVLRARVAHVADQGGHADRQREVV